MNIQEEIKFKDQDWVGERDLEFYIANEYEVSEGWVKVINANLL